MKSVKKTGAAALVALAAFGVGATGFNCYRDLRDSHANAAAAWREIGNIHAARAHTAHVTLNAVEKVQPQVQQSAPQFEQARAMLSQVGALPAAPALLDDPVALDTYKRYQGELTGALFSLAFGQHSPTGAAALDGLRSALQRNEAALAQARLRYRQAALKYNAIAATVPGALVGKVTGQGPVPPEV